MNSLFDFIGYVFGYILYWAYTLIPNFAIALLIFTIILRGIQFPFQIKSQKAMAGNVRLQRKQQQLQEKYGKDKNKFNEELQKLYEKENVNPMSGCITSLLPMFLLMGVYYTIRRPLTNTLHLAAEHVNEAVKYVMGLPVVGANINSYYSEIELINHFNNIKDNLTMFTGDELAKIEQFASGFNLFGMNLLESPNAHGVFSVYILIPILCFISYVATTMFSMRLNGNNMNQQQGCMKAMFIFMPLVSAWFSYSVPAAVGVYWILSSVIGFITTVVLHKICNAETLTATDEARRVALLESEEAQVRAVVRKYNSTKTAKKQKNKKK
ncbi:MAG: YidC/Oxa1 family membrane protein insertase [Lachnospiraceae bacterium]|nr:YidC/Oxa1 family membrane protein insertase [Lachnospiraceae bacterium]